MDHRGRPIDRTWYQCSPIWRLCVGGLAMLVVGACGSGQSTLKDGGPSSGGNEAGETGDVGLSPDRTASGGETGKDESIADGGGSTGDAGKEEDVSDPCASVVAAYCDDGNDCTVDTCDSVAGCLHTAVADNSSCDDHNACTSSDHCIAGQCVGDHLSVQAEVLGGLETFGGDDNVDATSPHSIATLLSEEYAVLAQSSGQSSVLQLVHLTPDGMELLDSLPVPFPLETDIAPLWGDIMLAHLVALSESRFVVAASHYGLEVYDVVGGKIVRRSTLRDDVDSTYYGAAGRDEHLWLSNSSALQGYAISADGSLTRTARINVSDSCNGLALAEDGKTLFGACDRAVRAVDVSDPNAPAVDTSRVRPIPKMEVWPFEVAVRGGYLLVQEREAWSTAGSAHVLRTSDFFEVATFPASLFNEEALLGGAFVDEGLLLQRLRNGTSGREFVAELYGISDAGAKLKDSWLYRTLPLGSGSGTWHTEHPSSKGRLAVLPPSQRFLWTEGGKITERRGLPQGTVPWVTRVGHNTVAAYGALSSHLVDISTPSKPVLAKGGLLSPGSYGFFQVVLPGLPTETPTLLSAALDYWSYLPAYVKTVTLTQFQATNEAAPTPAGSVVIDHGARGSLYGSSLGLLYECLSDGAGGNRAVIHALPRDAQQGATIAPLESFALPDLRFGCSIAAADTKGPSLVVPTSQATDGGDQSILQWHSRESGRWTLVGTVPIGNEPGDVQSVVLRGTLAGIVLHTDSGSSEVVLVERSTDGLTVRQTRSWPRSDLVNITRALGFHDDRLYLAGSDHSHPQVMVLRLDDLSTFATYDLPQIATSMAVVDDHLVFGMRTALAVATPACEPSPKDPKDAGADGGARGDGGDSDASLVRDGRSSSGDAGGPGDANGDGCVDMADYDIFNASYGNSVSQGADPRADFNHDGIVDDADYMVLSDHWGEGCSG